jgi:hypothetical protein
MSGAGNLMGILPALFHDYLGPRPTALLASILMCGGYSLIYMSAQFWIPTTYWLVGCFFLVFSAGESACFTAAMSTTIKYVSNVIQINTSETLIPSTEVK